jgi:hypothetical protein
MLRSGFFDIGRVVVERLGGSRLSQSTWTFESRRECLGIEWGYTSSEPVIVLVRKVVWVWVRGERGVHVNMALCEVA